MSDILWNIFEFIVNIYEGLIISIFIFICLGERINTYELRKKLITVAGIYIIMVGVINHIFIYDGMLALAYIIMMFTATIIVLKKGIAITLTVTGAAFLIITVLSTFITRLVSVIADIGLEKIYNENGIYRFITLILVQGMYTYVFQFVARFFRKRKIKFMRSEWIMMLSLLMISIAIFTLIHYVGIMADTDRQVTIMLLLSNCGVIIINIVSMKMLSSINKNNKAIIENEMLKSNIEYQRKYTEDIKQQHYEVKKIRHNIKQGICVLETLLRENKINQAIEYLERYMAFINTNNIIISLTDNELVNGILNVKLAYARSFSIDCECSCFSNFNGFENMDICNLLGNVLDNAIEACGNVLDLPRKLEIKISEGNYGILIKVKNIISSSVLKTNPNLVTTKNDKGSHGYGIATIRSISEKYGGYSDFYEEDGMFCCLVQLPSECEDVCNDFITSHISRKFIGIEEN